MDLSSSISKIVTDLYNIDIVISLTRPDIEHGDYSTNVAMQIAKSIAKNPQIVAGKICSKIVESGIVTSAEVAGPGFINLRVDSSKLASQLQVRVSERSVYGSSNIGNGQTIVCEFPSLNMAKPFSVGHIRAALQGWSIYKLMSLMGYNIITDNHVCDSGTPYGKWVVGFLHYSSDKQLEEDGINELSRIYILVSTDLKAEKEAGGSTLAGEVQVWLKKLENNDKQAVSYSERFNKISFDHMHEIMGRLGISTQYELGESKFIARGQILTDELLANGVAVESDGAVIVELEEFGINTPVILRKANGNALYATTDLATIEYREQHWQPSRVFIHTGQEQAFYFRQLNALAQKAGYKPVIQHLWHGLVDTKGEDGKREKMSSRKGVVLLETLLDEAEKKARASMKNNDSQADVKAVALAAVKFTDFTSDRKNGVLFDWDSMFSVQGFSGPAVQYAGVRISSIFAKATVKVQFTQGYDWAAEHQLLLKLLDFPELLLQIHQNYEMHRLASYLYALAKELNRYYEQTNVLKSSNLEQANRLWLLGAVRDVLSTGLSILGIAIPGNM